jgi:hypothetical protein
MSNSVSPDQKVELKKPVQIGIVVKGSGANDPAAQYTVRHWPFQFIKWPNRPDRKPSIEERENISRSGKLLCKWVLWSWNSFNHWRARAVLP